MLQYAALNAMPADNDNLKMRLHREAGMIKNSGNADWWKRLILPATRLPCQIGRTDTITKRQMPRSALFG